MAKIPPLQCRWLDLARYAIEPFDGALRPVSEAVSRQAQGKFEDLPNLASRIERPAQISELRLAAQDRHKIPGQSGDLALA